MKTEQQHQLERTAQQALDIAPQTCSPACDWYHQAWAYLRAIGVLSGIQAERAFFIEHFQALATTRAFPQVLVSGSADTGMLELLQTAYVSEDAPLQVSVVDRCLTPLHLNQRYADHYGIPLTQYPCDIFDLHPLHPLDVICTHSFFSFIPPEKLNLLLKLWFQWLRPGGHVLTSQLIRPFYPGKKLQFTPPEIADFTAKVVQAAADTDFIPLQPSEIIRLATRFAQHKEAYILTSADPIFQAFKNAGFQLQVFAPAPEAVQAAHRGAAPDQQQDRLRYQILAVKPAV
jgi:SAM-dependent methyltransferase